MSELYKREVIMRITLDEKGTRKLRKELSPHNADNIYFKCSGKPSAAQADELAQLPWVSQVELDGKSIGVQLVVNKLPRDCQDVVATDGRLKIAKLVGEAAKRW